jgi:putative transposase
MPKPYSLDLRERTNIANIRPGRAIKHFTAYGPVAKWTLGHVSTAASASGRQDPARQASRQRALQGERYPSRKGSEFMSFFEDHAATKASNSVVLPPKRLALNGCVERAQSRWRYEFYACYDLPVRIDKLQPLVDAFAHRYNHHRPLAISPQRVSKRHSPKTQPCHKC